MVYTLQYLGSNLNDCVIDGSWLKCAMNCRYENVLKNTSWYFHNQFPAVVHGIGTSEIL